MKTRPSNCDLGTPQTRMEFLPSVQHSVTNSGKMPLYFERWQIIRHHNGETWWLRNVHHYDLELAAMTRVRHDSISKRACIHRYLCLQPVEFLYDSSVCRISGNQQSIITGEQPIPSWGDSAKHDSSIWGNQYHPPPLSTWSRTLTRKWERKISAGNNGESLN